MDGITETADGACQLKRTFQLTYIASYTPKYQKINQNQDFEYHFHHCKVNISSIKYKIPVKNMCAISNPSIKQFIT